MGVLLIVLGIMFDKWLSRTLVDPAAKYYRGLIGLGFYGSAAWVITRSLALYFHR